MDGTRARGSLEVGTWGAVGEAAITVEWLRESGKTRGNSSSRGAASGDRARGGRRGKSDLSA
jgi:hypothetical protein